LRVFHTLPPSQSRQTLGHPRIDQNRRPSDVPPNLWREWLRNTRNFKIRKGGLGTGVRASRHGSQTEKSGHNSTAQSPENTRNGQVVISCKLEKTRGRSKCSIDVPGACIIPESTRVRIAPRQEIAGELGKQPDFGWCLVKIRIQSNHGRQTVGGEAVSNGFPRSVV
jgi:hypothetical protein